MSFISGYHGRLFPDSGISLLIDTLGSVSGRVTAFIDHMRNNYGSSRLVRQYGISAVVPGTLVAGFYVCPAVSWLLGWDRKHAYILIISTYSAAVLFVLWAGTGVVLRRKG